MRSTCKRCWPSTLKSVHVPFAQSVNQRQPLQQVSGNAMTRSTFAGNVCKLWHAEENFPEKHRQRQCSFFRVCLTCEMRKPCFKCGVAKPEAEFGAVAWKARNADRRCCRECTTKQQGCWQCSQCSDYKPRTEFTAWQQSRKYTQNGTQVCNACTALALVCRLAHRTNRRLARLRQCETCQRHEAILADVRKEIQKIHEARQTSTGAEEATTDAPHSATQQLAATSRVYTYICPHCTKSVQSTVAAGQVDHRRGDGCGKKIRVANGLVQAAHIRIHVQHAARWCTQQRLPAEFK